MVYGSFLEILSLVGGQFKGISILSISLSSIGLKIVTFRR